MAGLTHSCVHKHIALCTYMRGGIEWKKSVYYPPEVHYLFLLNFAWANQSGQIKGTTSALSVIQHGLHGGVRYTAWHVITVIVLAFLTQETRPVRCKQKYNKSIKRRAVRAIMVLGVWS